MQTLTTKPGDRVNENLQQENHNVVWSRISNWLPPLLLALILMGVATHYYLLFHTLVEVITIGIAILFFIVSWHSFNLSNNRFLLYLGCGYFWVAQLDFIHALVYQGMNLLPITTANSATQFWIVARYMEAVILLFAPYFLNRTIPRHYFLWGLAGGGVVTCVLTITIAMGYFPDCFLAGEGLTFFKITSEYIIIVALILAMVNLFQHRMLVQKSIFLFLVTSIILTIAAEFAFTLYASIDDTSHLIGHLFKFFSFWLIYLAIIRSSLEEPLQTLSQAIRVNQQRFQLLFDTMPSGVAVYEVWNDGEDFIFKALNQAGGKLSQVIPEEMIGRRVTEAFPGIKEFGLFSVLQKVHQTGEPAYHPINLYQDSRITTWSENYVYRIESGEIVAIYEDMSEQKKAETTLQQYASIVAASRDHMAFLNRDFIYQAANNAYLLNHAKERKEIVGHSVAELLGKEVFQTIKGQLDQCLAGESINYQAWFDFPGTGRQWMDVSYFPYYEKDGSVGGIVVTSRDMTERKQLEDALLRREGEAQQANQAKREFLANMSHEIRTPMNTIVGIEHLFQQTDLTHQQRGYLEKITLASTYLLNVINDVLDFSKIEAGKLELEMAPFNLDDVLSLLTSTTMGKAEEKGLEVLISIPITIPRALAGDAFRLGQVLSNLCSNAIKFTEQGEIVLAIEYVESDADAVMLKFSVRDSGIGLSKTQIKKLFEPFQQADTSTTRRYGGSGLGLSICRNLVEMMGGEMIIESEMGKGSCVSLTARFVCQSVDREPPYVIPDSLKKLRVLSVDNHAMSRQILEKLLLSMEFEVTSVESGSAALAELERVVATQHKPYELILLDETMPGLQGLETAQRIRLNPAFLFPPIIMLITTVQESEVMHQAETVGWMDCLIKPVTASPLYNMIMKIFGKQQTNVTTIRTPVATLQKQQRLASLRGTRILLVEDIKSNQELTQEILEQQGCVVTVANHGRESVDLVTHSDATFDLVLMDIQMPVMDGYEATRIIRHYKKPYELPIIAMSGNVMTQDINKCLEAGMNSHIAKPIQVNQLFDTLIMWAKTQQRGQKGMDERRLDERGLDERGLGARILPDADAEFAITPPFPTHLPGINVHACLERCLGDHTLFVKVALRVIHATGDMIHSICEAFLANDITKAHKLAHGLKGAVGNISAEACYDSVLKLEIILKNGKREGVTELLKQLEREITPLLESARILEAYHAASLQMISESDNGVDIDHSIDLLKRLQSLLQSRDMEAIRCLAELNNSLTKLPEYQETLNKIHDLVNQLDFQEAVVYVDKMVQNLSHTHKGSL